MQRQLLFMKIFSAFLSIDSCYNRIIITYPDTLAITPMYNHWYPIFSYMLGTGLRVGEVTGLRWNDVDEKAGFVDINHTLVYYQHADNGCYFGINTPKTKEGERTIPMM